MNHRAVHPSFVASASPLALPAHPAGGPRARRRSPGLLGAALLGLTSIASAACVGGAHPSGGTAGESGAVVVTVGQVGSLASIATVQPQPGRYFLTIQTTLSNVSASAPVPAAFVEYRLLTEKGLDLTPSPASSAVAVPCAADTSVTPGAAYTCTLAFEVPADDSPRELSYDDGNGDTAAAPISYTVRADVSTCETLATYQNMESAACQGCFQTRCQAALNTYVQQTENQVCALAACSNACAPGDCACQEDCLGSCKSGYDAFASCIVTDCASDCR